MSRQQNFEKEHRSWWVKLESQIAAKDPLPELASQYRRLARQLTLARQRHYDEALQERLGRLVNALHGRFYQPRSQLWSNALCYLSADFPATVRREWRLVSLSCLLLFGPMIIFTWLFSQYPQLHDYILDGQTRMKLDEIWSQDIDQSFEDRFVMWAHYVHNNVGIDFRCFATGLFFGIGAAFFMIFNGVSIGAVAGYLTWAGHGERFWAFVAGHSAPELLAAALSGAAGLRLGMGLLRPGHLPRMQAVKISAAQALQLLYGAAFMTFCAAFIEAFWSGFFPEARMMKYLGGGVLWIITLAYFFLAGRRRAA